MVLTLLLIAFGLFIIRSNIFTVKSVDVALEKIGCVDEDKIRVASNLIWKNIFFINSHKIESDLKAGFICVKKVNLSRNFPNKVKLSITGREPAAILMLLKSDEATSSSELEDFTNVESTPSAQALPSESFAIDKEGIIYSSNVEQIDITRIYVSGFNLRVGQKINEKIIGNALKILEKIKLFGVNAVDTKIYSEKIFLINGATKIIFKLDDNIDPQIASLQLILNKAKIEQDLLEFIDLRFDKPVVKLAPKKKN